MEYILAFLISVLASYSGLLYLQMVRQRQTAGTSLTV